jgi:glutathione S-transferase
MSRTLYGLSQSPWTERARWALDHHGVAYAYHEHVPMLGELLLRRKARTKKASVPLLADGDRVVMGSFEIARYADGIGRGASLFPRDKEKEIAHWGDAAERMLRVGRAQLMKRLVEDKAVQAEALPSFIPGGLRGALAPSAAMAVRFLMKKYDVPEDVDAEVRHTLRPLLEDLRASLRLDGKQEGATPYVLSTPTFTVVDLTMAAAMQVIRPHEGAKLGALTREAWSNDALARDFGDLLEWRDAIYRKHR